jgi:O-antigen/teichoic acid export membrane protein
MSEPHVTSAAPTTASQQLVLRNTLYLVAAQIIAVPLSVLVNAIVARTLGPTEFGHLYLATTFAAFGFLFVEWGQSGTLTGSIARDRSRAGELLGSGLVWRAGAALLISLLLIATCWLLDYDYGFLVILSLVLVVSALGTISLACQDVFRGLERTDFGAVTYVAWQLLTAIVVVPTMLLGGQLKSLLIAQIICAGIGALLLMRSLAPMGVPKLAVRLPTIKELFTSGTPFLMFGLVIALQPNIDALFLSKLAPPEAVGWHAAARKLTGLLIYPAVALISALYPTLCRLQVEDRAAFRDTVASALRITTLIAMPIALGCAWFPDLGIRIFSRGSYGPAENNLRVLAVYLLLVYFSMPLGSSLTAVGRQRAWAITQFACVVVSVILDPLLIPWFQTRTGNGGLGVCVATVVSEILMVAAGLYLLPKGILDRALVRKLFAALLAGSALSAVAWSLSSLSSFIAAPLAMTAYVACLWMTGGLDRAQLETMRALFSKKVVN